MRSAPVPDNSRPDRGRIPRWCAAALVVVATATAGTGAASAAPYLIDEGFDSTAFPPAGWTTSNRSVPLGETGWQHGSVERLFIEQAGSDWSVAMATSDAVATSTGTIDAWLVSPAATVQPGDGWSFYARTGANSRWPDRVELRVSDSAACDAGTPADGGSFGTVLTVVNPDLEVNGFPGGWTRFHGTVPAGISGSRCFALRYHVTPGTGSTINGYGIAVDTVDFRSAPETTVEQAPPARFGPDGAELVVRGDSPGTVEGFECSLDGETFRFCSSDGVFTFDDSAPEGHHQIHVRAVDETELVDPTPVTVSFTVDRTAPEVAITDGPSGTVTSRGATFAYASAADDVAAWRCRLTAGSAGTGAFAPCPTTGTSYQDLADGTYTFEVQAIDTVGNVSTAAARSFTVAGPAAPGDGTPDPGGNPGQDGNPGQGGNPDPGGNPGQGGNPDPGGTPGPGTGGAVPDHGGSPNPGGTPGPGTSRGPSIDGPAPDAASFALRGVRLTRSAFRPWTSGPPVSFARRPRTVGPRGTVLQWTQSRDANVTLTFSARRGSRWVALRGTVARRGRAGTTRALLRGRVGGRTLAPGRYRVTVTARAADGTTRRSAVDFRITR